MRAPRSAQTGQKAIDINLRCAVALKVIGTRFIGDEAARRRFVREARAAASVRHPNVASVFHLGQSGAGYFYAMEYVEGETLENLIKRCGRLEPKIALEIKRNESPLCQIERDQDAHSRGRRRAASCPLPRLSGIVVLLAASIEGVG